MAKVAVAIVDKDEEYLERLTVYIKTSEFQDKIDCKTFSSKKILEKYIASGKSEGFDILLSPVDLMPGDLSAAKVVIELYEKQPSGSEFSTVFKYQPVNNIVEQILNIYMEKYETDGLFMGSSEVDTRIVSVFSASGGSGKTIFSLNLANQLTLQGKNVFYINLESYSSVGAVFSNGDSFSKLLYYLKKRDENLNLKLEQLKKFDSGLKMYYLEPLNSPRELAELEKEDLEKLMKALVDAGNYDFIVLDLDSVFSQLNNSILTSSHHIFWLLVDDLLSLNKNIVGIDTYNELSQDKLKGTSRVIPVVNKYRGSFNMELPQREEFRKPKTLPYISGWKALKSRDELFASFDFTAEVRNIARELIKD